MPCWKGLQHMPLWSGLHVRRNGATSANAHSPPVTQIAVCDHDPESVNE